MSINQQHTEVLQNAVLEIATLNVIKNKTLEFEEAFKLAAPIIASMSGYVKHELHQCLEDSNQYVLLVWWKTLEAHTVEFRQSAEYQKWKNLLHHYYDPFPTVLHYKKLS